MLCLALPVVARAAPFLSPGGSQLGISANPGAANPRTGTGQLAEWMGLKEKDTGVFVGGVWVGDSNYVISGGKNPHAWSWNSLFVAGVHLDAEKLIGWKGASFGIDFLQFDGQRSNDYAGSAQGYNGLPGPEPLERSQLYQLFWRQELFDGKFNFRVGKMVASQDFNNVLRPVSTIDESLAIPSVSGLGYTPVFKNPTLIGVLGGYYNSTCGIVATLTPAKNFYLRYGIYDGNIANGVQTGMVGPQFNGYYLNILEAGAAWEICDQLPGAFGMGVWQQSGLLRGPGVTENSVVGGYLFGSQRLWLQHPGKDNSGISGFFQFGANNSITRPFNQYFGMGFTGFGLVPTRPQDSAGVGMAWSWLNPREFHRSSELMFQSYYQAHIIGGAYLQPSLSYIPTPGLGADLGGAWVANMTVTVLF
jgi:porin